MASLLHMAGLLTGIEDLNNKKVKEFADKITSYCEGDSTKAARMDKLFEVFKEDVMPNREAMGEEGFNQALEAVRDKIAEIGGVTGFLPSIEGSEGQKKS